MPEPPVSRFTYRAFISYSHRDRTWADWLHRSLESWRVPRRLVGTRGARGPLPARLSPVFRDREELASSADLGRGIEAALAQSECLIVICSPAAATSRWVNAEVHAYQRLGGADRIFCLIVAGEPHATDIPGHEAKECFCPALRFGPEGDGATINEPVAADARPHADGKTDAKLKLFAGVLGVGFDALKQREMHRRRRRLLAITAASVLGMAIATVAAINAYLARNEARQRQAQTEDALNFMLGDLHDKLAGMGRLDLMAAVTDKAMALFADSKPGSLTDLELTQQSRALVQIGEIRLTEGRSSPAMEAFQRAYQRSEELTTRHPDDGRFLYDRAQAESWIGTVYWQQRRFNEASTWLTHYRDSALELARLGPRNDAWLRETGYGEHNLAVLALERGDLAAAQHGFQAELAVLERSATTHPEDAELDANIADATSWLAVVAERRGDLAEAQRRLNEQVRRLAALRTRHPEDFRWLAAWATAQELHAASLATTGRVDESLRALDDAAGAYRSLTQHDPRNVPWRVGMAGVQVRRASYELDASRSRQVEIQVAAAIDSLQHLGSAARSQDIPRVLSRGWLLRARLALRQGHLDAAEAAAQRSLAEARNETAPQAVDDGSLADQADALLMLGMAQRARSPNQQPAAWAQARALLASRVQDSRYWRLLDPWLRVCLLTGDTATARVALDRLDSSGYVPLQPWPSTAVGQSIPATSEGEQREP